MRKPTSVVIEVHPDLAACVLLGWSHRAARRCTADEATILVVIVEGLIADRFSRVPLEFATTGLVQPKAPPPLPKREGA